MRLPIGLRRASCALYFMCGGAFGAQPDRDGRYELNLEGGPLSEVQKQFQQQTGLMIWCRCSDEEKRIVTNPVHGRHDLKSALDLMLAGTGGEHSKVFSYVFVKFARRVSEELVPRRAAPRRRAKPAGSLRESPSHAEPRHYPQGRRRDSV